MPTRREFLLAGASAVVAVSLPGLASGASPTGLKTVGHARRLIGHLSRLERGVPLAFFYPWDHPHCASFVVKLGAPASGGIGPGHELVAFNALCTHQGGDLSGTYDARYRVAGPCPMHLTTFDLTRHGMVVAGHATESLPQVRLGLSGDQIFATGMMGLIYGLSSHQAGQR